MKVNFVLIAVFISIVVYASTTFDDGVIGATQLNGEGCACHALDPTLSVNVRIEGPDTIALGETGQYRIFLSGGPAIFGGFNVAARFNDLSPVDTTVIEIAGELTHNFPQPFPSINDTIFWTFNYTATTEGWDTIYSASNSVNGNGTPEGDEWNFGPKFPIFVTPPVPVELISFSGIPEKNGVRLNWKTSTELNNSGFKIERLEPLSSLTQEWKTIGFIEGKGTSSSSHSYSFLDLPESNGIYYYRLMQIDFNGTFSYSNVVTINFYPIVFTLEQNYPNPFNPETNISFNIPEDGHISLKIYNVQGELVDKLSDGLISAGNHSFKWNALSFSSGVYFYKFDFENESGLKFTEVKKMILSK